MPSFKRFLLLKNKLFGGLSSALLYMCDNKIYVETNRMCIPDKHFFENGGRRTLKKAGLGQDNDKKSLLELI